MLKMKTWILPSLSAFLMLSSMASAESLDLNKNGLPLINENSIEQNIEQAKHSSSHRGRQGNKEKHSKKIKPLQLKDFEGAYLLSVDTIGGVFNTISTTNGSSLTFDGQATIDKHGNVLVNFVSGAAYAGFPGHVQLFQTSGDTFKIVITNATFGTGTVAGTFLGLPFTIDFVVIRSKEDGSVLSLQGHRTDPIPTANSISLFNLDKQYQ